MFIYVSYSFINLSVCNPYEVVNYLNKARTIKPNQGVGSLGKMRAVIVLLAVFGLGWMLNSVLTSFIYYDAEKPFSFSIVPSFKSPEQLSPSDHIKESQINVYDDKVILNIKGANWASFTDTNSMDPFLDSDSNSIEIKPASPESIKPGDIISYYSSITGDLLVHRVVTVDSDVDGVYYIVKGDNNNVRDPEKVRFDQIHGVLVAIIY
jgi:hypothetical protein